MRTCARTSLLTHSPPKMCIHLCYASIADDDQSNHISIFISDFWCVRPNTLEWEECEYPTETKLYERIKKTNSNKNGKLSFEHIFYYTEPNQFKTKSKTVIVRVYSIFITYHQYVSRAINTLVSQKFGSSFISVFCWAAHNNSSCPTDIVCYFKCCQLIGQTTLNSNVKIDLCENFERIRKIRRMELLANSNHIIYFDVLLILFCSALFCSVLHFFFAAEMKNS